MDDVRIETEAPPAKTNGWLPATTEPRLLEESGVELHPKDAAVLRLYRSSCTWGAEPRLFSVLSHKGANKRLGYKPKSSHLRVRRRRLENLGMLRVSGSKGRDWNRHTYPFASLTAEETAAYLRKKFKAITAEEVLQLAAEAWAKDGVAAIKTGDQTGGQSDDQTGGQTARPIEDLKRQPCSSNSAAAADVEVEKNELVRQLLDLAPELWKEDAEKDIAVQAHRLKEVRQTLAWLRGERSRRRARSIDSWPGYVRRAISDPGRYKLRSTRPATSSGPAARSDALSQQIRSLLQLPQRRRRRLLLQQTICTNAGSPFGTR